MSTLKEKWRSVIIQRDWQKMEKLYEFVYNEKLIKEKKKNEEKMRKGGEDFTMPNAEKKSQTKKIIDDDGKERTVAKFIPFQKQQRENVFADDGTLYKDERVDLEENKDKLDELMPKNIRKREPGSRSKKINVICSVCGKSGSVNPVFAGGYSENEDDNYYRCDDCLSRKGK